MSLHDFLFNFFRLVSISILAIQLAKNIYNHLLSMHKNGIVIFNIWLYNHFSVTIDHFNEKVS